jgi:hypothetical protein
VEENGKLIRTCEDVDGELAGDLRAPRVDEDETRFGFAWLRNLGENHGRVREENLFSFQVNGGIRD